MFTQHSGGTEFSALYLRHGYCLSLALRPLTTRVIAGTIEVRRVAYCTLLWPGAEVVRPKGQGHCEMLEQ